MAEAFSHDEDGHLTQDGTFNYTWNAENRLIAVTPRTLATGAKKVKFVYDYRRPKGTRLFSKDAALF